jgi:MFS family permease
MSVMILIRSNSHLPAGSGILPGKQPVLWSRDFVLVCLYNLLIFLSFNLIMATLPVYVATLGYSTAIIGLVSGIFTVSSIVMRPFSGKWLDKYGREGLWIVGSLGFLAAAAGHNWAVSISALIALRIFHGAMFSIVTNASSAGATDLTPKVRLVRNGFFGLAPTWEGRWPGRRFYLIPYIGHRLVVYLFSGIKRLKNAQ